MINRETKVSLFILLSILVSSFQLLAHIWSCFLANVILKSISKCFTWHNYSIKQSIFFSAEEKWKWHELTTLNISLNRHMLRRNVFNICRILTHRSTSDADSESLLLRIDFSASQLSISISAQDNWLSRSAGISNPRACVMLCLLALPTKSWVSLTIIVCWQDVDSLDRLTKVKTQNSLVRHTMAKVQQIVGEFKYLSSMQCQLA